MSENPMAFIPTRSSMLNKKSEENFKAVTYSSYKKKNKEQISLPTKNNITDTGNAETFNIKRARHEIIKFGISGFDAQKKEEAKVQLAIGLGAKPPRNKNKNYKQLLEEKKKEKQTTKTQLDFQQLGKNQVGRSTAKGKSFDRKRKKQKSDLLDAYGQVKFKPKPHKS